MNMLNPKELKEVVDNPENMHLYRLLMHVTGFIMDTMFNDWTEIEIPITLMENFTEPLIERIKRYGYDAKVIADSKTSKVNSIQGIERITLLVSWNFEDGIQ